jgi:hypothetical protein
VGRYNIYHGSFPCHTCKVEVKTLRLYTDDKEMTWMCPDKHVSTVSLKTKKSRKDFDDEAQQ